MAAADDADPDHVRCQSLLVDGQRIAELVDTCADLGLDRVDASIVVMAERLGVAAVATLDLRHFRVVRPRHVDAFTLLP